MALRRGSLEEAEALAGGFLEAEPDSVLGLQLELMLGCVKGGSGSVDWEGIDRRDSVGLEGVSDAAQSLSAGGRHRTCAEAAARAALAAASDPARRWGAFLVLHNLLLAQGRLGELRALVGSDLASGLPGGRLFLLDATLEGSFREEARAQARVLLERGVEGNPAANLWLLGQWAANGEDLPLLERIVSVLRQRADSTGARRDSFIAGILDSRLELVRGDTAGFLAVKRGIRRDATLSGLLWDPWEALAGETLTEAEILLRQGRPQAALEKASEMDSHRAVVHLAYLPRSLELRAEAARSMGDPAAEEGYRQRLTELRGTETVPVRAPGTGGSR
jgi:hypothetical protein